MREIFLFGEMFASFINYSAIFADSIDNRKKAYNKSIVMKHTLQSVSFTRLEGDLACRLKQALQGTNNCRSDAEQLEKPRA